MFEAGRLLEGGLLLPWSGRAGPEVAAVDFVHGGEVSQVFQEDGAAENLLHANARSLQNGGEILEHAVGLGAYVSGYDLLSGGINGHLSGCENQALGSNGLRVGSDGLRGLGGRDHFAHDSSCVSWGR